MGYRGETPVLSPRVYALSDIWDFAKRGRGTAPDLTDHQPVGL